MPLGILTGALAQTLLWAAVAIGAFVLTFSFPEGSPGSVLGPALWPRVLCILLLMAAIGQAVTAVRNKTGAIDENMEQEAPARPRAVLAMMVIGILYVAAMPWFGFYASTPIFAAAVVVAMGERHWLRVASAAATITAVIFLVFVTLLYVPLPAGRLPGFYDFSNLLLQIAR